MNERAHTLARSKRTDGRRHSSRLTGENDADAAAAAVVSDTDLRSQFGRVVVTITTATATIRQPSTINFGTV